MAEAIVYPEAKFGRPRKSETLNRLTKTDSARALLSYARLVLAEYGRDSDIVRQIMHGGSLRQAYEHVLEQRRQRDQRIQQLEQLRERHPEFAAKVDANEWSLTQALAVAAAFDQATRERTHIEQLQRKLDLSIEELANLEVPIVCTNLDEGDIEPITTTIPLPQTLSKSSLEDSQRVLTVFRHIIETLSSEVTKPAVESYDQRNFVRAIRNGTNQIIALITQVADNYNHTLTKPSIRKVK
jgi:hypothetical protein